MNNPAIEIIGLRKRFKDRDALSSLDLLVPAGSIFGFLGRNGAGKTTTIKSLMGMIKPDSGAARILGLDVTDTHQSVEARRRVGLVTEDKDLYPYMTVDQVVAFTRPFFPKWRDDLERRYRKMFDLPPKSKVSALSKGMRSKLMLLLAICRGADLLILDEPTDGLDPAAVEDVLRELIAVAGSTGVTIFFSSHQLGEVEQIADTICIIDKGRAIVAGGLDDLKTRYQRLRIVLPDDRPSSIRDFAGIEHFRQEGRTVSILARDNLDAIVSRIDAVPGATIERFPAGLKEIFLEHVRSDENALV